MAAQAFTAEDRAGLHMVFDSVDDLCGDPRQPTAFPWGCTAFLRLRVDRYRVLYEIKDGFVRIDVMHLGRSG